MIYLLIALLIILTVFLVKKRQYEDTEYYRQTKNSYLRVRLDKGLLGEFCTYTYLKPLKGHKRYLFNLYIPKTNGETTEL